MATEVIRRGRIETAPDRLAALIASGHLSTMADQPNIKPDARLLVEGLPESATWDDLAYEVYVRQAIEVGLADADAERTLSHEEAIARVRSRIRRAS
jgi:hypothetical protein